jgi:hypothetical protein
MKLARKDCPDILKSLRELAREYRYTKIFAKVPSSAAPFFLSDGYIMEAFVPGFYRRREAAFFVSKYLNSDRLMQIEHSRLHELGTMLEKTIKAQAKEPVQLKETKKLKIRELDATRVKEITGGITWRPCCSMRWRRG